MNGTRARDLRARVVALKERARHSEVGEVVARISPGRSIIQATVFASSLFVSFLPLLIVVASIAGRNVATNFTRRLGLNAEASAALHTLFGGSRGSSTSITAAAMVVSLIGGLGTASTLQRTYEELFAIPPSGVKGAPRLVLWVLGILSFAYLIGWARPTLSRLPAGSIVVDVLAVLAAVVLFFFTMAILVGRRVPLADLWAPVSFSVLLLIGFRVLSALTFSRTVIADERRYGPIGVAFALVSWMIELGIVIVVGAAIGIAWNERGLSFHLPHRHRAAGEAAPPSADDSRLAG